MVSRLPFYLEIAFYFQHIRQRDHQTSIKLNFFVQKYEMEEINVRKILLTEKSKIGIV